MLNWGQPRANPMSDRVEDLNPGRRIINSSPYPLGHAVLNHFIKRYKVHKHNFNFVVFVNETLRILSTHVVNGRQWWLMVVNGSQL